MKIKRNRSTWILLTGVLLLGAVIFFLERESRSPRAKDFRTLFAVYPESVEQLITERDGVVIECVKDGGSWKMIRPLQAAVDSGIVERMVSLMSRVERGERIAAETLKSRGLTPSDYGFDDPRARISFKNNRGTFSWLIGRDAPIGDTLYVMAETARGDIITAPQRLLHLIPKDPSWIRDRTLFDADVQTVRGLDMNRGTEVIRLRHEGPDGWKFQQPYAGRADLQTVQAFIEKLLSGRISEFIEDEKENFSKYGLEPPDLSVTLFTRDERTRTLHIGKPLPENEEFRYARHLAGNTVFAVPSEWYEEIGRDPVHLRSRRLTDLEPERITSIRLARGEQQVELVRTNRHWKVVRPVRWDASAERVNEVLRSMTEAPVEQFINEPSADQDARVRSAQWELELAAGARTRTFRVSAPGPEEKRLVQVEGESSFYTVPVAFVREAYTDPVFYRSPLVLSISPSEIRRITVRAGQQEDAVHKTQLGIFVSETPGRTVTPQTLMDLVRILGDLRVDRYVVFNPESVEPYGFNEPHAEMTVFLEESDSIGRILRIGNTTDGGRFAMIHGQPLVFVLPEKSVQIITAGLTQAADSAKITE